MPIVIVVAIAIIVSGVIFRQTTSVSSDTPTPTPLEAVSPSPSPDPSDSPSPSVTKVPTQKPPVATPKPTSIPNPNAPLNLRYPGSSEVSAGVYTSTDDTDKITDWYKDQINAAGYNVKSFVKTKTNDNVSNKLSASKEGSTVGVDITKSPSSSTAKITVVLDNN